VRFPSAAASTRLKTLADGDPSLFVRGSAVRSLAALDPQAALPVIEGMLGQDSWTDVQRVNALAALGHVPADRALPILEQYVGPGRTRFARQAAIETIIGVARGHEEEIAHRLEPLLSDPDLFIRAEAAQALGALGQRSSVAALEARRRVEAEGRVVQVIDQALTQLRGS
jgi:HEAT repeat protein